MKKKTAIIIIILAVIILIAVLLFLYFRDNTTGTDTNTTPGLSFPTSNNDNIFPTDNGVTDVSGQTDEDTKPADIRQIFSDPVSGSIVLESALGPKVRFVERSNGNVHENILDSTQSVRITNTTIPKIQEVLWGKGGDTLIYRYLKDETDIIETFSAKIKLATSTSNESNGEVVGTFLPTNIKSIAVNNIDNKIIFTQEKTSGEGNNIFVSGIDGSSKKQLADTKLNDITLLWPSPSVAVFFTNPTYKYNGFLYKLSPSSGATSRIMGDISGFSPLPNKTLTKVLYSQMIVAMPSLKIFDITDGTDSELSVKTLSDKCVWSNVSGNRVYCAVPKSLPNMSYPDAWYQGLASFSDDIWEINTDSRSTKIIASIDTAEFGELDMINPMLSKDDSYFVFTNKTDLSLWVVKIK